MAETVTLGRTEVRVPRLGLGVMIWGEASGAQRLMPAKSTYGGTNAADEQAAFDASLAAEINFFDTAAMYSAGGSERRLGELAEGKVVVIATKFPPPHSDAFTTCPPHWTPASTSYGAATSTCINIIFLAARRHPALMELMADAVEAGKVRAVGVSNYSANQMRSRMRSWQARYTLASNQVEYSCCIVGPRPTACWRPAGNSASL